MRALPLVLVASLLLLADEAGAVCLSDSGCLCTGSSGVATAIVEETATGEVARIDSVTWGEHAVVDAGTRFEVGEVVELAADRSLGVGTRVLIFLQYGGVERIAPLEENGEFVCSRRQPSFVLTEQEAISIALSPRCRSELEEHGFEEPPCNDHGVIPGMGCNAGGAGSGAVVLLLIAVLLRASTRSSSAHPRAG